MKILLTEGTVIHVVVGLAVLTSIQGVMNDRPIDRAVITLDRNNLWPTEAILIT
jgi:hypothetical protein